MEALAEVDEGPEHDQVVVAAKRLRGDKPRIDETSFTRVAEQAGQFEDDVDREIGPAYIPGR